MEQRKKAKETKQKKARASFRSVRTKIIGVFLIPVLFIILLGFISYRRSSRNIIENYEKASLIKLEMLADYYELGFQSVVGKTNQFLTNESIKKYYSGNYEGNTTTELEQFKLIQNVLASNAMNDSVVSNIYVFADYGSGASTKGTVPSNLYSVFKESEEGKAFLESKSRYMWRGYHHYFDQVMNLSEDDYAFSLTYYLYSTSGRKIGLVVTDIKQEFLTAAMKKANLGEGSIISFLTMDGREVLVSDGFENFRFVDKDFVHKDIESGFEYIIHEEESYLYLQTKLEEQEAVLCAMIPKSLITSQVDEVLQLTIGVVVLACFIAVLIGSIFATGISKTIKNTNDVLHKTSAGDLTVVASMKRKDEFAQLADGINTMITGMRELIHRTKDVTRIVTENSNDIANHSTLLVQATQEINHAVVEIDHGTNLQAVDSEECLSQMTKLAEQIGVMSENVTQIDRISNQTKDIVSEGILVVNDLSNKAKDTVDATQLVIGDIEKLEEKSITVDAIINSIHSIAGQTNLLALNASIEAARAGEAGKGFAVVADEIRKLADQSKGAAIQISHIITEIIEQTKGTVTTARRAEEIVASQESTLNRTVEVFFQISGQVEQLSVNLTQILSGIQEIGLTKEDTLSAVGSITSTMQQTAASTEELEATTINQLQSVEALHETANKLKKAVKDLEEAMDLFVVV